MLLVHTLIEQIASGRLNVAYDVGSALVPHPDQRIPALLEPILVSHKFAVNVTDLTDDALYQSARELWINRILKAPFLVTWWEVETPRYIEGLLVRADEAGDKVTIDIFHRWDGKWFDWGVQASVDLNRTPLEAADLMYAGHYYEKQDYLLQIAIYAVQHLMTACCLLIAKEAEVETVAAPDSLNKKRERAGKPPLFEHKTITVPGQKHTSIGAGTHASPRLHWRRGHVRTLPSGILTAVRPCLVGLAERGIISKDYAVALMEGK